jgi:multicomponent K+:H+ antiporter subunit D
MALLAATVAMSVWAAPIQRYTAEAAVQLLDRQAYARAVLGEAGLGTQTTRPYRFPAEPGTAPRVAPTGEGVK